MTRQLIKDRELALFTQFQAAFPHLPVGALSQPDPPEPDIVIAAQDGDIAVELSELHPAGQLPRLVESEQAGITHEASQRYAELGGPPVLVDIYWASTHITGRVDRPLAGLLAQAVLSSLPRPGGESILDDSSEATHPLSRPEIDRIWIYRPKELKESFWGSPQAGSPISIGAAPIQWELDRNADKPARYRRPYRSSWIILVVEAAGPSTWVHVPNGLASHPFVTPFSRAFLLDYLHGRSVEIGTAHPGKTPAA